MAETGVNFRIEQQSPHTLLIHLSGTGCEQTETHCLSMIRGALRESPDVKALYFDSSHLTCWDSRLVAFVRTCQEVCRSRSIEFHEEGLPADIRRLLQLAQIVPERTDSQRATCKAIFLQRMGEHALKEWHGTVEIFAFLGDNVLAFGNLLRRRAQFRWSDAFLAIDQCGPQALGIVALINFLVGMILAFVGALQLIKFGASIYVADLVGIATVREMAAIMTGIILCGRTGAAFAAQLGTMKVNEEINALKTFGFSPVEFLVLPRMIALILTMPFLCAFADFISIAGGLFVASSMLDTTPREYLLRTVQAIDLRSFLLGIGKGSFFGFLVAYTGCLRGMQSGSSAAAVGEATTSAVVTGITAIIASDGLFAVLTYFLQI